MTPQGIPTGPGGHRDRLMTWRAEGREETMRGRILRAPRRVGVLALVAVMLLLSFAPVAGAPQRVYSYDGPLENVVMDWNLHAIQALGNAATAETAGLGQGPTISSQYLAMVHGAIYDAINMIDGGYQPYLKGLPAAPRSASKAAAVATAAHDVLTGVVIQPAPPAAIIARLGSLRDATLAAATAADGPASVAAGVAAGKVAATAMLAARANDGRYGSFRFTPGTKPGEWRPTSVDASGVPINDPNGWVARVKPFVLESTEQVRSKGPNALTSDAYATEYNEVKLLGSATSVRTPAQQAVTDFFPNTTNPIEMFNRTFRTIAMNKKLTLVEQARLFAMLNLAGADSLIACWADKAHWNFWRPVTAIREGESDGNPKTVGDPTWTPLIPATPYPEHVSGYNCAAAGLIYAGKAFFGTDEMAFEMVKIVAGTPNVTRQYSRFSDVCKDVIDARVYQGLHFRIADVQGELMGRQVAEWMAQNYFQPRPGTPAPPSTGSGGNLPGLPNTGAGGGGDRLPVGWLVLVAGGVLAGTGLLVRRRARRA